MILKSFHNDGTKNGSTMILSKQFKNLYVFMNLFEHFICQVLKCVKKLKIHSTK